jgi:hypothetical protein
MVNATSDRMHSTSACSLFNKYSVEARPHWRRHMLWHTGSQQSELIECGRRIAEEIVALAPDKIKATLMTLLCRVVTRPPAENTAKKQRLARPRDSGIGFVLPKILFDTTRSGRNPCVNCFTQTPCL